MTDFLVQQKHDIEGRLAAVERELGEVERLVMERERLQAALSALGGSGSRAAQTASRAERTSRRRRPKRGSSRKAILQAVKEAPGSTAGDVAKVTGIPRDSVATSLSQLAKAGALSKAERGYALPS